MHGNRRERSFDTPPRAPDQRRVNGFRRQPSPSSRFARQFESYGGASRRTHPPNPLLLGREGGWKEIIAVLVPLSSQERGLGGEFDAAAIHFELAGKAPSGPQSLSPSSLTRLRRNGMLNQPVGWLSCLNRSGMTSVRKGAHMKPNALSIALEVIPRAMGNAVRARFGRFRRWPNDALLLDEPLALAEEKMSRLNRIYAKATRDVWDGPAVSAPRWRRHDGIQLSQEKRVALAHPISMLMWGELAAWIVAAELAERLDDPDARLGGCRARSSTKHVISTSCAITSRRCTCRCPNSTRTSQSVSVACSTPKI